MQLLNYYKTLGNVHSRSAVLYGDNDRKNCGYLTLQVWQPNKRKCALR